MTQNDHHPEVRIPGVGSLPLTRDVIATAALAAVLLIGGFVLGRLAGTSDPLPLRTPALSKVSAAAGQSPLVKPEKITIPRRVSR